jgi:ribose 5-phosphate isomerase B
MRIYLASDHAGFELKKRLISFLRNEMQIDAVDEGPYEFIENDDYPDFISKAMRSVLNEPESRAIILGGSGEGEAIVANRYKGVRAVVYYGGQLEIVKLSREHNNSNVLSLGARFLNEEEAKEAVRLWIETDFSEDERHIRRIKKIDSLNS